MPISGIAVQVEPEYLQRVESDIPSQFDGEVASNVENFLVIVLETETTREMKRKFEGILQLPGVITAWIAYHNTEDLVD